MKLSEAIRLIRNLPTKCEFVDAYGEPVDSDAYYEAVDIAISALQVQDLQPTCNKLATDTIYRQAALEAINHICPVDTEYDCTLLDRVDVRCVLSDLPSAQPEPPEDICGECDAWNKYKSEHKTGRWIPCSERLPEDGENCLVSVRCSNNFLVDRGTYSTDLFNVDEEDFFGNRGESGWYYLSSEYGYCRILNVIAWMPLPEPYKEVKE